jgi:hypothetical protein
MVIIKARVQYKAFIYLQHHYPNGITLDRHNSIKRYIQDAAIYCKKNSERMVSVIEEYPHEVELQAKEWLFTKNGLKGLYANANVMINDLLVEEFDKMFIEFMNINFIKKNRPQTAILAFMHKYKIDEEYLSFDTLKKAYYRYRKNNELFPEELKKISKKGYSQIDIFGNIDVNKIQNNKLPVNIGAA